MIPAGAHEWAPYCGPAPAPAELLGRWNVDPILVAVLIGIAVWSLTWGRLHVQRPRFFWAAFGLAVVLFVSPFCALTSALFSARVVHHVVLAVVLAPLLIFSFRREPVALPGSLPAWTAVQAIAFWLWHAPGAYGAALSNDAIYWVMQASLLGTSLGFWFVLRRSSAPAAVGALLITMVQMGLLGALITLAGAPLYAPHLLSTEAWGLSALEDQQLAGLIMWAPAAGLYLAAALTLASRWLRSEQRLAG